MYAQTAALPLLSQVNTADESVIPDRGAGDLTSAPAHGVYLQI